MNKIIRFIAFHRFYSNRVNVFTVFNVLALTVGIMLHHHVWAYPIKIRELTELAGVKKNFFIGYGLVTGLSGTGDRRSRVTQKSLSVLLAENGLNLEDRFISTRNSAAVIVTAKTTGFLERGDTVDITVSSLGDARSLANGILLPTPLKAGNGIIYIVASGNLTLATEATTQTRSVIVDGGVIERDFTFNTSFNQAEPTGTQLYDQRSIVLKIKGSQLDRSALIKSKIETTFKKLNVAFNNDKTIVITHKEDITLDHALILQILNTEVEIPSERIVVIDQNSGIVIAGGNVAIEPSFISLPDLSLNVSQPTLESLGYLKEAQSPEKTKTYYTTIEELLTELQSLELDGYQIGSIFKALKKSGAINAELIFQ
ncbi:flagellar P-ring protein [Spirochaetota bacterium]|nr:flagellar P-ring protein [Spirochaetota bacterium]